MTNKQQEEYKKKGLTVWVVMDIGGVNPKIHLLKGNERFIFKDLEELDSYIQQTTLGINSKAAWEPYRGNLIGEPGFETTENKVDETLDKPL